MDNVHPKMRFSLSPPPPKSASVITSPTNMQANYAQSNNNDPRASGIGARSDDDISPATAAPPPPKDDADAASDYNQWLHAMKLVARLPGGMPPEFRRKLWLSLADKYLKSKNIDWAKEEEKCFCEKWREDDEELGIQIVKDLHRTGSNLCTGPAGSINQAKLKRILLGYARYNPEVGYCQGFNMLGALILQVMEKEEAESMKVMIYLVEGVLPPGYFHGSMGGLQADMAVFRELMQTKLPRLAKHLQKLQGPIENAYEPPLTNVFTMQWFLTLFCTCLPMTCVLRVWDLVLIEGSDVLLRTALVLWSLLEDRVLSTRTADDFYGKMGSFSSELLNGHLIDSNGLIEKVVQLGPIPDIQRLRDKHLYNITPLRHKQGLQFYYDDEEPGSDEESRLAVATVWGMPWGRRGSQGNSSAASKQVSENKERLALDISLLKKQYDRLRERQRQAHIILTTACTTARQSAITTSATQPSQSLTVNQLLLGRPAIVTNKGRRIGPPLGAIPPARKPSLPTVLHSRPPERQLRRGETLHWRDTDISKRRRDSLTWKEIKADRASLLRADVEAVPKTQKLRTRVGKSDSSSYSEESEDEPDDGSSTDTSLCDDDDPNSGGDKTHSSSIENSPKRRSKSARKARELAAKLETLNEPIESEKERRRPKSWAPSSTEIPFMLMTSDSPTHSADDEKSARSHHFEELMKEEEDSTTECDRLGYKGASTLNWPDSKFSTIAGDLATTNLDALHIQTDVLELPVITSTSQLSPMPDIAAYLNSSSISPLPMPKPLFLDSTNSLGSGDDGEEGKKFAVNDDGVTNEYFERVNSVERPTKLDLFYSLNEEDGIRRAEEADVELEKREESCRTDHSTNNAFEKLCEDNGHEENTNKFEVSDKSSDRRMELLIDYSEKSSAAFIAAATNEVSTNLRQDKTKDATDATDFTSGVLAKQKDAEVEISMPATRDSNIPGKAVERFEENLLKTAIPKPNTNNIKAATTKKSGTMSNACRKRRDPRRLTLTRSSTIEIEERFQALERRMSEETFVSDKEKINNDDTSDEALKRIVPSTADLEQRLTSLEKQMSKEGDERKRFAESSECRDISNHETTLLINRQFTESRHEKTLNKNSFEGSAKENVPAKTHTSDIRNNIPDVVPSGEHREPTISKQARNRIPSTSELEDRFSALERQLSSNGLPTKSSMDMRRDENGAGKKDLETPPNTPTESNKPHLEKGESKTTLKSDIETEEASEGDAGENDKPRIKKLPSTAELEDRFNALERRMSAQKASPSKTKKEPPDEVEAKEINTKKEPSDENASENEVNIQAKKETVGKNDSEPNKVEEVAIENVSPKGTASKADSKVNKVEEIVKEKVSPKGKKESQVEKDSAVEAKTSTTKTPSKGDDRAKEDTTKKEVKKDKEQTEHKREDVEKKSVKAQKPNVEKRDEDSATKASQNKETENNKELKSKHAEKEHEEREATRERNGDDSKNSGKKSPPSTEELEKRFKALEKQMSSASLEGRKVNKSLPESEKIQAKADKERRTSSSSENRSQMVETKPETSAKAMKSFEDKCRQVNKELSQKIESELEKTAPTTTGDATAPDPNLVEIFNKKCIEINTELAKSAKKEVAQHKAVERVDDSNITCKRRASEPPSTEDLEKRYESLKRRMSTKTIIEKGFGAKDKSRTAFEEESTEETPVTNDTKMQAKIKPSGPPSTEDLESRYEALQRRSSEQKAQDGNSQQERKARAANDREIVEAKTTKRAENTAAQEISKNIQQKPQPNEAHSEASTPRIPVAPPMPLRDTVEPFLNDEQHRALIEEFQSKIKVQPNGENLKPSDINPNRRTTPERQRTTTFDGTSEAHANTAFFRSENYEPWYSQPHKMVRRFSDLPSRADLENRLHFLERQLIIKFYKQRCASDSEVASRKHFLDVKSQSADNEAPSTSARSQQQAAEDLEKRVLALEKQLSENSLKLLEAVRVRDQEAAAESSSPRRLSSETVDATGKELVRYVGELEEPGSLKPINISINIKMLLKRNEDEENKPKDKLPTAAELEKRLEVLEQQLKMSRSRREGSIVEQQNCQDEVQELKKSEEKTEESVAKEIESNEAIRELPDAKREDNEGIRETPEIDKVVKEAINEECKSDNKVIDTVSMEPEEKEKSITNAEALKAEKTLENQQIARSNKEIAVNKEVCEVKAKSDSPPKMDEVVNEKTESNEKTICSNEDDVTTKKSPMQSEQLEDTKQNKNIDEDSAKENEPSKEKQDGSKELTTAAENQQAAETSVAPTQTAIQVGSSDPNNKTLVLLLDNEPKAVKVRRLTRANTEELENLFQALEKQLSDRNLIKSEDGKLVRAADKPDEPSEESKALAQLSKEIEDFTKVDQSAKEKETKKESAVEKSKTPVEDYDWGPDPVKRHLKRKTVHLPSTKELEARFRSLERQIKLLEDVEKIDVEQRLNEIERKIKMQYSLSHEKDLTKFLELCEGKSLDELPEAITAARDRYQPEEGSAARTPTPKHSRSPYTSPSRAKEKTPHTSPVRTPRESRSPKRHTSPGRVRYDDGQVTSKSPKRHGTPGHVRYEDPNIPTTEDLEYRFRALELPRSKSKESLTGKSKKNNVDSKKSLIHPLEMLLDPSSDEDAIPTTGELEHRIRVLDDKRKTPSPSRQSRSRSPTIEDIKNRKLAEEQRPKAPIHSLETLVASPTKKELPTAEELEARMRALEEEHCFDFKMQKTYQEFNQKLKDAVSPSLSFEEFKTSKSREESPRRSETNRSITPKSALRDSASNYDDGQYRSTSPKAIRFRDEEDDYVTSMPLRPKSRTDTRDNIGRTTLTDSCSSINAALTSEGLDELGSRLMRETSPLQRTGSHTGVPLRTNDNINERLDSIKNTIKSIDTLCEEKPYRKERCQRYIDSLFSDSIHFASKKTSLEDLSRSDSRAHRELGPSIRISDHSQRHADYLYGRSLGSAESIRSTSPLRAASPLHHRSNRDLRREISPRRRHEEEREEYQSRVRRENMLPNYSLYDSLRDVSSGSLIKFHKVDRQLDTYKCDERDRSSSRSASRSPLRSPYGSREMMMMKTESTNANTRHNNTNINCDDNDRYNLKTMKNKCYELDLNRPYVPAYRHNTTDTLLDYDSLKRSNTPVYVPGRLDIRHTTVTSTFYDRLLAEKEIERKFSRPSSRSPIVSPSVTSKSYVDLMSASTKTYYHDKSPTTTLAALRLESGAGATSSPNIQRSAMTTNNTHTNQSLNPLKFDTNTNTTTTTFSTATLDSAKTPTGNSSIYSYQLDMPTRFPLVAEASKMDLRIRSCDNILMQIKSNSITAAGLGHLTHNTTTPIAATATTTTSTTGTSTSTETLTSNRFSFPTTTSTNYGIGLSENITNNTTKITSITTSITTTNNYFSTTNITNTATTTLTTNLNINNSFTGFDRLATVPVTTIPSQIATTTAISAFSTNPMTMTTTTTYNFNSLTTITKPTTHGNENTNNFYPNNTSATLLSYNTTSGGGVGGSGLFNTPLNMALTMRQSSDGTALSTFGLYTSNLNNNNFSSNNSHLSYNNSNTTEGLAPNKK
ncbi:titin isoform X2 [Rhagoletis pomonella]|uniref:titin isoform X2 n=1 Tax=Rhagoletis pomonella TaxID=28610 RepID=UPI001781E9A6|nr:titin isoform X2 [Rhagoletis pomonella]